MNTEFDFYQHWLGISPHQRPVNHYLLLGLLPFETDANKIASAAAQRIQQIQAQTSGPHAAAAQQLLSELSAAQFCLLDPNTKASYDSVLRSTAATPVGPTEPPILEQDDVTPFYTRPWFPILILCCLMFVGTLAIGIGRIVNQANRKPGTPPTETPVRPSDDVEPPAVPGELPHAEPTDIEPTTVVFQQSDNTIMLLATTAAIQGDAGESTKVAGRYVLANWTAASATVRWQVKINKPGFYRIELRYAASEGAEGARLLLECGGRKSKIIPIHASGGIGNFISESGVGVLFLKQSGIREIDLKIEDLREKDFYLEAIELKPVAR